MTVARIVVGFDASPESLHALRFAFDEAQRRDALVHVVTAFTYPYLMLMVPFAPDPPTPEQLQTEAVAAIDRAIAEIAAEDPDVEKVDVRRDVVAANPVAALVSAADGADLLIVGARGGGGFAGLRLGSVSQQCAQHTPCPIVIVPVTTPAS
jgi:nucleotide-binding universal stress UspA family protein